MRWEDSENAMLHLYARLTSSPTWHVAQEGLFGLAAPPHASQNGALTSWRLPVSGVAAMSSLGYFGANPLQK